MVKIEGLINSLSEIILYIVYGFVCTRVFSFTSSIKIKNDAEHILIISIVVGFIIDHIMKLIPINISPEIDTIGVVATSLIIGFLCAKIYQSNIFNKFLFNVCKINATTDSYIWDTIIKNDYPVLIKIITQDNLQIIGFPDLVEEYTDDPHITIANYKIYNEVDNCLKESKESETLFFDLKNAKYYEFKFHKNDPKRNELIELMSNDWSDYE